MLWIRSLLVQDQEFTRSLVQWWENILWGRRPSWGLSIRDKGEEQRDPWWMAWDLRGSNSFHIGHQRVPHQWATMAGTGLPRTVSMTMRKGEGEEGHLQGEKPELRSSWRGGHGLLMRQTASLRTPHADFLSSTPFRQGSEFGSASSDVEAWWQVWTTLSTQAPEEHLGDRSLRRLRSPPRGFSSRSTHLQRVCELGWGKSRTLFLFASRWNWVFPLIRNIIVTCLSSMNHTRDFVNSKNQRFFFTSHCSCGRYPKAFFF